MDAGACFKKVFSQRGAAYTEIGELDSAIADFEKALQIQPDHAAARSGLQYAKELLNG